MLPVSTFTLLHLLQINDAQIRGEKQTHLKSNTNNIKRTVRFTAGTPFPGENFPSFPLVSPSVVAPVQHMPTKKPFRCPNHHAMGSHICWPTPSGEHAATSGFCMFDNSISFSSDLHGQYSVTDGSNKEFALKYESKLEGLQQT